MPSSTLTDTAQRDLPRTWLAPALSFLLVLALTIPVQLKVPSPMLLAERFWPGTGWIEIAVLATYASLLTRLMIRTTHIARWRSRYWSLFAVVFFLQLVLGLTVSSIFLMTGVLHIPVPILIAANPIYNGDAGIMVLLLLAAIVAVGPGWCSHLCYIGALDDIAARRRKSARKAAPPKPWLRFALFAAALPLALAMRLLGVPGMVAASVAILFGLGGLLVMATLSRRSGQMVHCTAYCPLGALVVVLGKISPFRLRVSKDCDMCGACGRLCRYGALQNSDLESGQAGLNCTLCGDCLHVCKHKALRLTLLKGRVDAWPVYVAMVVSLHAVSLGLARL